MKSKTLLLCAGLMTYGIVRAQNYPAIPPLDTMDYNKPGLKVSEVMKHIKNLLPANDTNEGSVRSKFGAYSVFWSKRVERNDSTGVNMFNRYLEAAQLDGLAKQAATCGNVGYQGEWQCIGPNQYPNQQTIGRMDCVWVNPNDNTASNILVGTFGGLFRTTNQGGSWQCLTDNTYFPFGLVAIRSIAVHPTQQNNIYLGTTTPLEVNRLNFGWKMEYGIGVVYSNDNGQNWNREVLPGTGDFQMIPHVFFSPNGSRLYALGAQKVFSRTFPTGTWQDITPPTAGNNIADWNEIEFLPGSNTHFVISAHRTPANANSTHSEIWECDFSGSTPVWTDLSPGLNFTRSGNTMTIDDYYQMDLAIRNASSMYVLGKPVSWSGGWNDIQLYSVNVNTHQWTLINPNIASLWGGCEVCFSLESNTVNPNILYMGENQARASMNGGVDFNNNIGAYWGMPTHGDIRDVFVHRSTNTTNGTDDVVFFATDGGISIKRAGRNPVTLGENTLENISQNGPAAIHMWGVGTSEEGNLKFAGGMDDGMHAHEPAQVVPWFSDHSSDSYDAYFDRENPTIAIGQDRGWDGNILSRTAPAGGRVMGTWDYESMMPTQFPSLRAKEFETDADNTHYAAMDRLVERQGLNGVFDANTIAPIINAGLPIGEQTSIIAFDMVPTTLDVADATAWVAYEDGRLFYKNPALNPNGFVSNQTYPYFGQYGITDISLNPQNPNQMWMSRRGINWFNEARIRVTFTPDGGNSWHDISKGLPVRLPVTSIVYQEGSSNVYAATDIGIYRCDMSTFNPSSIDQATNVNTSVQWVCFSKGKTGSPDFPNVVTTDLEINYCAGTLLAATYGRSLWETPLWKWDENRPGTTNNISNNTVWSSTRYLTGSVLVKAGKTLSIVTPAGSTEQTRIHMPNEGIIRVEPGGKLIVNNARITNTCEACFWKGIEAWGNSNLPQTAAYQATVSIENGAILENARNAITNWDENSGNYSKAGAIIKAHSSTFLNNRRSISFVDYHNTLSVTNKSVVPNLSTITNCTFILNNGYKGDPVNYKFSAHITMSGVEGVKLFGNRFINQNTGTNHKGKGNGIASWNSGYHVEAWCNAPSNIIPCPNLVRHEFDGFQHGINASGDNTSVAVPYVDRADFRRNSIGINAANVRNISVIRSFFTIGNQHTEYCPGCDQTHGIKLENTGLFRVEENTFNAATTNPTTALWKTFGTTVINSGKADKDIYKNQFNNLYYAGFAKGSNGGNTTPTGYPNNNGLQFLCNTYTSNLFDIYVERDNNQQGIRYWQGSPATSAGNIFLPQGQGRVFCTWLPPQPNYYYLGTNTLPGNGQNFVFFLASATNGCVSRLTTDGRMNPVDRGGVRSTLRTKKSDWSKAVTALNGKIDGGNRQHLLDLVDQTTSSTAPHLRDELVAVSPYVSEEVLRYTASQDKLPLTMMMDVLNANPEVLRNNAFLDFLATGIPHPIPADGIDELENTAQTSTSRSVDESKVVNNYDGMQVAARRLITDMLLDTLGAAPDSLITVYDELPDLWARYAKAGCLVSKDDYTAAYNTLDAIRTSFTLTTDQEKERTAYIDLYHFIQQMRHNGINPAQLTVADQAVLAAIGKPENGAAGIDANTLLQYATDKLPTECVEIMPLRPAPIQQSGRNEQAVTANKVEAFPNPAQTYVNFSYDIPVHKGALILKIVDIRGTLVKAVPLKDNKGQTWWDTRQVASGTYLYQIVDGNKSLSSGKVIIAK